MLDLLKYCKMWSSVLVIFFSFMVPTEGYDGEGESPPTPLPSPPVPPSQGAGLYSVLLKLHKRVTELELLQEKDRLRLRRLERRTRQYRDTMIQYQEEAVQQKQLVVELRDKVGTLEEQLAESTLESERLDYELRQSKQELTKLKEVQPLQSDAVQKNMSHLMSVKDDLFQNYATLLEDVEILQKQERVNTHTIVNLRNGYTKVAEVLKIHMKNRQKHVAKSSHGYSNDTIIWASEETQSGDGSGDINLETIPSKSNINLTDQDEGSGEDIVDELGSLFPSVPVPNITVKELLEISELKERVGELEHQLEMKLDKTDKEELTARTDDLLKKHDSYFEQEITKRDKSVKTLEENMFKLGDKVQGVENRVLSIQLGDFMQKLQESLINFTQNVITLDQWKMASDQIINSTQFNQEQITSMTNMILNNSRAVGDMDWKLTDQRLLSDQQYRVLRMHIIRLNNSVQDLREHVEYIGSFKSGPATTQHNGHTSTSADVMSRVEDLALQIIYNENRIARLENKVINQSLFDCQKSTKDIFQDSRLLGLEKETSALSTQTALLSEMLKRIDRAIYRVHTNAKNNSVMVNKLWSRTAAWQHYIPIINLIRQEVNNLLTQVPKDCDGYQKRGFTESGSYIVYPQGAAQSVFVYCSMDSDGGWTVIQRRVDGKLNFSRSWLEYAVGFGSSDAEFWLGNEYIHLLTIFDNYTLRIEMKDIFSGFWFVEYDEFAISSKEENYKLHIHGFHGNATDGLEYSNDMAFSTQDKDNDLSSTHCAAYFTSGWWYRHCQYSNLNGRYKTGIVWFNTDWQDWVQMKSSVMKIKPRP